MKRNRYRYPTTAMVAVETAAWSLLALLAGIALAIVMLEATGHGPLTGGAK